MKNLRKFKTGLKNLMRSVELFNQTENEHLTEEFCQRVHQIKERNSEIVFNAYYLPKTMTAILREENYLTTHAGAKDRAVSMLIHSLRTSAFSVHSYSITFTIWTFSHNYTPLI